jgi:ATP-dependent Zn protease
MKRTHPGKPPSKRRDQRRSEKRQRSEHGSDESCEPTDIRATAYHEAGHAVAATILGTGLVSVDIKGHSDLETMPLSQLFSMTAQAKRGYLGFTRYLSDEDALDQQRRILKDPDLCRRLIIVASAGPSAEAAVLRDDEKQGGYEEDTDRIYGLAAIACCGGELLASGRIESRMSESGKEFSDINALMDECFWRTEIFLKEHWAAVKAVAMALLERKSLTGAEVAKIVEANSPTSETEP